MLQNMHCALLLIAAPVLLLAAGVGATSHSQSKSHSHSHSHSQGTCRTAGVVGVQPSGPAYRDTSYSYCNWMIGDVDNAYGAQAVYPCVFPGGPVLAPTEISLQLSTGDSGDRGNDWVSVFLAYNYSHFHRLNPRGVPDCYNEPTPGPHNPPFLDWFYRGSGGAGCDRICIIEAWYRVQCGADYASAKSGLYYVEIPHVGRFNFNVSICISEKFSTDYAAECFADMSTCPQLTADVLGSGSAAPAPAAAVALGMAALAVLLLL